MRKPNEPFISDNCYHVYNRAVGNEKLFFNHSNYIFFLSKLKQYALPVCDIFAYRLLPNHFHLFIRIKPSEQVNILFEQSKPKLLQPRYDENGSDFITEQLSKIFISYSKSINNTYKRKGKLFMDNFNRKLISDEIYFSKIIQYIHFNPVKHNYCIYPHEWKYSSYNAIIKRDNEFLKSDEVIAWYGNIAGFLNAH
jgi:putative transposase